MPKSLSSKLEELAEASGTSKADVIDHAVGLCTRFRARMKETKCISNYP